MITAPLLYLVAQVPIILLSVSYICVKKSNKTLVEVVGDESSFMDYHYITLLI